MGLNDFRSRNRQYPSCANGECSIHVLISCVERAATVEDRFEKCTVRMSLQTLLLSIKRCKRQPRELTEVFAYISLQTVQLQRYESCWQQNNDGQLGCQVRKEKRNARTSNTCVRLLKLCDMDVLVLEFGFLKPGNKGLASYFSDAREHIITSIPKKRRLSRLRLSWIRSLEFTQPHGFGMSIHFDVEDWIIDVRRENETSFSDISL